MQARVCQELLCITRVKDISRGCLLVRAQVKLVGGDEGSCATDVVK